MKDKLAAARAALAKVIAAGRPKVQRIKVWDSRGHWRLKTVPDSPLLACTRKALDDQASVLGMEIKRLELERGTLEPRSIPRVVQIPPRLRPDRRARTPRTGRWGFGSTPLYQGGRSPPPEKLALCAEWARTTLEEVAEPCLKQECPEMRHYHGRFATGGKHVRGRKVRPKGKGMFRRSVK